MCFWACYLSKKKKNGWKALYIGKEKDITRKVYECFIVWQEPQGKKLKNSCKIKKFLTYQKAETHE